MVNIYGMLALYQTLVLRTLHLNFLHDCTASRGVKAGFQNFKLNFRNQSQVDGGRETEGAPVSTQQPKAGPELREISQEATKCMQKING